jgi:homoserine kinase
VVTPAPAWRDGPVTVRVPATSANLGPGFDSFGLALDLCNEVTAAILPRGLDVDVEGESADDVARDESHLVVRAARATFAALDVNVPGLRLRCHDRVPHTRGLGSSAAAIVAGVMVARALVTDGDQRLDAGAVIRLAARLEGHPDNVAAAVLGGFTLAWCDAVGARAVRLEPVVDVTALVPAEPVATAATRRLLPVHVTHADATYTAGRAGLLVAALTGRPDLLLAATEDRLHQPYRATVMPQTAALVSRLRAAGHAAVVSGAGPSVLVLHAGETPLPAAPPGWRELAVPVDRQGARVVD